MYDSAAVRPVNGANYEVDNKPMLGVIGYGLGAILSLGVGLFWSIGAIGLLGRNAGTIVDLGLEGVWRWAYLSYPVVLIVFLGLGLAAFALKRHLEAAALATAPVVLAALYYFALVLLR